MGEVGSKVGFLWVGIEPRPSVWKANAIVINYRASFSLH